MKIILNTNSAKVLEATLNIKEIPYTMIPGCIGTFHYFEFIILEDFAPDIITHLSIIIGVTNEVNNLNLTV